MREITFPSGFGLDYEPLPEEYALISDLEAVGLKVRNTGVLLNTHERYPEAIPVLIKHLVIESNPVMLEVVARCLSIGYAKGSGALDAVIFRYKNYPNDGMNHTKYALANAIESLIEKKNIFEIIPLVLDHAHGPSRIRILNAINKFTTPEGCEALQKLTHDSDEWIPDRAKKLLAQKKWDKFRKN
jgi:hypothetical protein